jgi:hypothetical protein
MCRGGAQVIELLSDGHDGLLTEVGVAERVLDRCVFAWKQSLAKSLEQQ